MLRKDLYGIVGPKDEYEHAVFQLKADPRMDSPANETFSPLPLLVLIISSWYIMAGSSHFWLKIDAFGF
jgi:hypothetical protein